MQGSQVGAGQVPPAPFHLPKPSKEFPGTKGILVSLDRDDKGLQTEQPKQQKHTVSQSRGLEV